MVPGVHNIYSVGSGPLKGKRVSQNDLYKSLISASGNRDSKLNLDYPLITPQKDLNLSF